MSFTYVVIIFIFLFHITPLWLSGIYLINNNLVANSSVSQLSDRIMDVRRDFAKAVSMRGLLMVWSFPQKPWGVYLWPMQLITSMSRVVMSSMARPWPSPVIRLKTTWEKIHHLWITMSQKEPQLNYMWILNLYPTLMNVLVISPSGIGTIQPSFPDDYINGVNDDAWLKHVHKVLAEKQGELQDIPVTYSGFFSHCQGSDNVRPRTTVGVFLFFFTKKQHQWQCKNMQCLCQKR